jgi:hypothetical protein
MSAQQPGQRPRLVVAALAALAVAAVAVLVAAAHVTPLGHGNPAANPGGGQPTVVITRPPPPTASAAPHHQRKADVTPLALVFLFAGLLATAAGLVIIFWLVRATLRRRSLPRRLRFAVPDLEPPAELVAEQVGSAVERALSELRAGGPVDDAIIRCWLQLEAVTDEAGMARDPSDTPEEAIERLFAAGRVRGESLRTLADLYREARFSRHPMTRADADAARDALTGIVAELSPRVPEPAQGGGDGAEGSHGAAR